MIAVGSPSFKGARRAGEIRDDLSFVQVLDMVLAIAKIEGDPAYLEPILEAAFAGLRP